MNKDLIYYIEINIACILVMLVLMLMDLNTGKNDNEPRLFLRLTISNIVFCLSDIAAMILRGTEYSFSNAALWVANGLYLISLSFICFFWLRYAFAVINRKYLSKKFISVTIVPLIIVVIMTIASYKTGWFFSINESNLYSRGGFIWLHWIQMWSYLLIPSLYGLVLFLKNTKNRDCLSIAIFAIPPVIAGIVQMRFYGITANQLGITISILIVYLRLQNRQIFIDGLTGLYNRGGLNKSLERLSGGNNQPFYMLLLDINRFKEINDAYGHIVGDQVLMEISNILRSVEATRRENVSLYRYGGDEFIVIGHTGEANAATDFMRSINAEINLLNNKSRFEFDISVSIGIEQGYTSDYASADEILNLVDSDMYKQKSLYRKRRDNGEDTAGMYSAHKPVVSNASGPARHSLDINQRDLNNAVIKVWLLIVMVLVGSYLLEVFKGERSVPYYAVFVCITLIPWHTNSIFIIKSCSFML